MAASTAAVMFYNTEGVYIGRTSSTFITSDEISDAIYDAQRQTRYPEGAERTNELGGEKVDYSNKLYTLNFYGESAMLYQVKVTPAQISRKVQKLMNNGEEYIISGGDLPSGGTTGQVLTKTETGAEWKDAKGGIASTTVTTIVTTSSLPSPTDPNTLYFITA